MAFVHVEHGRGDTDGAQRPQAADPEQEFLADASLAIATVQRRRDLAKLRGVALDVGVQEVEGDSTDLCAPDRRAYGRSGHCDLDVELRAVRAELPVDRHVGPIIRRVALLLPPVHVEGLAEVSVAVQQSDADERQAQVGCRLEVIPRQDAKSAGIDGKRGVETELERQVCDAQIGDPRIGLLEPAVALLVGAERGVDAPQFREERLVARGGVERRLRNGGQHHHRVAIGGLPGIGIETCEQLYGGAMPRVPQVTGDLVERPELRRKVGMDVESVDAHRARLPAAHAACPVHRNHPSRGPTRTRNPPVPGNNCSTARGASPPG